MNIKTASITKGMTNFRINKIIPALLVALGLRLLLVSFGTLSLDHNTFVAWSVNLAQHGFSRFYQGWCDYLPGYLYVLWGLGKIHLAWPLIPTEFLYKLPAILADLATGFLIYKIVKDLKNEKWGLVGAGLYLFNPAILANSTLWGQVDSLTALFALLAVYLAGVTPWASGLVAMVGFLVKPQAALVAPVLLFIAIKNRWRTKDYLLATLPAVAVFTLFFLPFANGQNVFLFAFKRLLVTLGQYPYTSVNAFSAWAWGGMWGSDSVIKTSFGYLVILVVTGITFRKVWRKDGGQYLLMAITFLAGFMFQTRMHERHLLPSLAPLLVSASLIPDLLLPYLLLSVFYVLNLRYAYVWITDNFRNIFTADQIKLIVLVNLTSLAFVLYKTIFKSKNILYSCTCLAGRQVNTLKQIQNSKFKIQNSGTKLPEIKAGKKYQKWVLVGILIFAAVTRFYNLGTPPEMYFDEVYHAFTAKLVLHSDPKAWEWWNPHPEGFAYEWTHPPLAKLGMALGMAILGENAWGWRSVQAFLGVGCVYLVYLIAKKLFDDEWLALFSAGIYALDGLVLVMSRIGMNDTYFLFFMLWSLYLFFKDKNFWSALTFGLAVASKWSAIYAVPIYGVYWLLHWRNFKKSYLWFLLLPPLVYVASYWQMFVTGHGWEIFTGVQQQMWWYHTNLKATHAYTSLWYTWPFDIRPVYMYTSSEVNNMVARIYNLGNPMVFWAGLVSVFSLVLVFVKNRSKNVLLVIFAYFIFFVPWALSPRIMFFYHYLPSIPFMCIALGYVLRKNLRLAIGILAICLLVFIYFYPHWAGLQVPLWLDKSYYWFASWR